MVDNENTEAPVAEDLPEWKRPYTVPLDPEHPDCAHPGDCAPHDNLHKTLDVIRKAYDWFIDDTGRLYGLVSGDMGWAATSIVLTPDSIHEHMKKPETTE